MRGINKAGKRQLIERWAKKEQLDIICVSETRACNRGMEGGGSKLIGEEEWGTDWKWYFTTSVDMKQLEEKAKMQKAGKQICPEVRNKTTEYAGCATIIHRRLWHLIDDVRPINGRIMKTTLSTAPKSMMFSVYAPQARTESEDNKMFTTNWKQKWDEEVVEKTY